MFFINESDLFTLRQLDLENKLILPTPQLCDRISFKTNMLYQDIHNALINAYGSATVSARQIFDRPLEKMTFWYDPAAEHGATFYTLANLQLNQLYQEVSNALLNAHSSLAGVTKQIYEHPHETASTLFQQVSHKSAALFTKVQTDVQPVYQQWHANISRAKENTIQELQTFLDHPQETTIVVLKPVTRNAAAVLEHAERNLQQFMENPEQFLTSAFAPAANYLSMQTESTKTALLNTYNSLVDLVNLLASQPNAALHSMYNKTLSALLDIYYDIISSLLVMV